MVYIRHDNYKYAVANEAMKVSRVVTQFNDDWINDTSEIVKMLTGIQWWMKPW